MAVTVVTRATATGLTTPKNVRDDLGLTEAAWPDQRLARPIAQASATAAAFCRSTFGRETVREAFAAPCGGFDDERGLLLGRAPAIAVASVTMDGAPLDATGWSLEEEPAAPVSLYWLRRLDGDVPRLWGARYVVVEYQAGWFLPSEGGTVPAGVLLLPADVERAVIQLVGVAVSAAGRDAMVKQESVEGVGSQSFYVQGAGASLPHPEAEAALAQYRRMLLG